MRQAAYAAEFALARPARRPMIIRRRLAIFLPWLLSAVALALFPAAPARAAISYDISLAHPGEHKFHVTMTIPFSLFADDQWGGTVQMPAWNALYQIRDFAYRVSDFRATGDGGEALSVRRIDKQTWRIEGSNRPMGSRPLVHIEYTIFWDDPGPFGTQLSDEHAFLN